MSAARLTAVGCHVYAGGFSLGARQAGFRILAHLEEWPFGVETARRNMRGLDVRVGTDQWRAEEFAGRVDWLYGNPPCASWSEAGRKVVDKERRNAKRWSHDGRTACTELLFSLIPVVRPSVFTWESVAAATVNGAEFVEGRIRYCHDLGYDVTGILFNGADCGLPQTRRRFFFVAHRVAFDPAPPPLLCGLPEAGSAEGRWLTVGGAIRRARFRRGVGDFEKVLPLYREVLATAEPGEPLHHSYMRLHCGRPPITKRGTRAACPGFMHQKVDPDRYAPTVGGSAHLYHWDECRTLSVREMQVICGYPPDYEFVGSLSARYAQVAKAVLPPAARWLAGEVRGALTAGRPVSGRRREARLVNFIRERRRFAEAWEWDRASGNLVVVTGDASHRR